MNIDSNKNSWCCYIPLALALILYCFFVYEYGINIPVGDDYGQQLGRATKLHSEELSSFDFLFKLHNGHRIFTTMLMSFFEYWSFGSINIKNQLLFSTLLLVCLSFTLISFSKKENRLFVSLICCSILLVPNYAASLWLGGSTPYYALVLFGVLSLKMLRKIDDRRLLFLSLLCSFLAIHSLLSGFLVSIVGTTFLLFCQNDIARKSKFVWILLNAVFLILYFQNYAGNSLHPSVLAVFESPIFTLEFFGQFFSGFWVYLVDQEFLPLITYLMSAFFIWVVFVQLGIKNFLGNDLSLPLIYLILLSMSVVVGRVGFNSLDIATSAKYFVFTKSLWILAFCMWLNANRIKKLPSVVLGICLFAYFAVGYKAQIEGMKENQKQLSQGMVDALFLGDHSKLRHPNRERAYSRLKKAIEHGLYSPQLITSDTTDLKFDQRARAQSRNLLESYTVQQAHGYVVVEFALSERPLSIPLVSFQKDIDDKGEQYLADALMWSWGTNGYRVIFKGSKEESFPSSSFELSVGDQWMRLDSAKRN